MKLFHLSDLHLGKSLHEFSLLEDQEHILKVVLGIADAEQPRAVLIAGDVFDRTVAPTEALRLFDDFLDGLARRGAEVFVISGNHDSADRLAFGARLMDGSGVHISRAYDGKIEPFILSDEHGEAAFYLLPFLKPVQARKFHPDAEIEDWTDAVRAVIANMDIDGNRRNILLCHQFVTGAATCESEELSVGGADNVDADAFAPFDYVALGHLHGKQHIGRETLRYCGTPLKYSFSESGHVKSLTVVELGGKGDVAVREIPLAAKRDMREIRGKYMEITAREYYRGQNTDDYLRVTLTDEDDQPDAVSKLRVIYPKLMRLDYDNKRSRAAGLVEGVADAGSQAPIQLFETLFEEQNGRPLSDVQRDFMNGLIAEVWEGGQ
ncbi:MAG: exonuclease SbcCD subunit D [Clostridiales Family XIII bacterium]|jgi:exonuclease SbcD|nr:exonuclease SbcCD subunit D [Clostridiales Family XIII bacterium]